LNKLTDDLNILRSLASNCGSSQTTERRFWFSFKWTL